MSLLQPEIWALLVGGLIFLVAGGELLVRGAARLAGLFGISPLVVGLTVVAYGTSTPELAVSVQAGLAGNDSIAVANVVGSNSFNILAILGVCALILPLTVSRQLIRVEVPIMIAVSVLAYVFCLNGKLGKLEGLLLALGCVIYTVWTIWQSRAESKAAAAAGESTEVETIVRPSSNWSVAAIGLIAATLIALFLPLGRFFLSPVDATLMLLGAGLFLLGRPLGGAGRERRGELIQQAGFVLAGLGVLVIGARWLVDGAVTLARGLEVNDSIIGLTIVAAGTSLPEVATSIVATIRGQRDIAIGNVVGSNIYNVLAILGFSSLVTPGGLSVAPEMIRVDIPIMVLVALSCLPIFFTQQRIDRWEGALFFSTYIGYTTYLVLQAGKSDYVGPLGFAAVYIALPLIAVVLLATALRAWKAGR